MERGGCIYYAENQDQLKKDMDQLFPLICLELEGDGGKKHRDVFAAIWIYIMKGNCLKGFPISAESTSAVRAA